MPQALTVAGDESGGLRSIFDGELVRRRGDLDLLDDILYHLAQVECLDAVFETTGLDSRYFEQVVDQARQAVQLRVQAREEEVRFGVVNVLQAPLQKLCEALDGSDRRFQFMADHAHKFVFAPLHFLALVDMDHQLFPGLLRFAVEVREFHSYAGSLADLLRQFQISLVEMPSRFGKGKGNGADAAT